MAFQSFDTSNADLFVEVDPDLGAGISAAEFQKLPGVSNFAESPNPGTPPELRAWGRVKRGSATMGPQSATCDLYPSPRHPATRTLAARARDGKSVRIQIETPEDILLPETTQAELAIAIAAGTGVATVTGSAAPAANAFFGDEDYAPGMIVKAGADYYVIESITSAGVATLVRDDLAAVTNVAATKFTVYNAPAFRRGPFATGVNSSDVFTGATDAAWTGQVEFAYRGVAPEWTIKT